MIRNITLGSILLALSVTADAAVSEADLAAIRAEMAAMKAEYEQRIQKLEQLLDGYAAQAEAKPAPTTQPAVPRAAAPTTAAKRNFNPDIGVILTGTYADLKQDPEDYAIPGFALAEETGPGERGFSLGESELVMSANVDNLFYGSLTAALTPEETVEVEEAYMQTLALPHGLTLKAGRFFSSIGYQNAQHNHVWDFVDSPLAYRAMLGGRYGDDGVQLTWLAPTDMYLLFGAELMRGDGFPAGGVDANGAGARAVFAKTGADVGTSHSWQAGLSHLRAKADDRESGEDDIWSGDNNVSVVDFVWKWAPYGDSTRRNFKFQTEYFLDDADGAFNDMPYDVERRGWYAQGIYQFMPRWRLGLRYDRLDAGNPGDDFTATVLDTLDHRPERYSLMADWSPSEFSRLRLQYNRDESRPIADHQWYLQYIMSIGAHGGHRF